MRLIPQTLFTFMLILSIHQFKITTSKGMKIWGSSSVIGQIDRDYEHTDVGIWRAIYRRGKCQKCEEQIMIFFIGLVFFFFLGTLHISAMKSVNA